MGRIGKDDEALAELQTALMVNPEVGNPIPRSGASAKSASQPKAKANEAAPALSIIGTVATAKFSFCSPIPKTNSTTSQPCSFANSATLRPNERPHHESPNQPKPPNH